MKLLFITQKVDRDDDVLGFVHLWLEKLAPHFEHIVVICLEHGVSQLPANIKVHSLGKESGASRFKYLWRFFRYLWQERQNYDGVFVHMNPEYLLLGGLVWRWQGKQALLWYNHTHGAWKSRLAFRLASRVLYVSPYAVSARLPSALQMPAGIDTEQFRRQPEVARKKNSLLSLGRISPVKRLEVLLEAAAILDREGVAFRLDIYGAPTADDKDYFSKLRERSSLLTREEKVSFAGSVPNYRAPDVYNSHEVFMNLTESGSFDKTILEAMACETLVLVSNRSLAPVLPPESMFREGDVEDLAKKLNVLMVLTPAEKEIRGGMFREYVVTHHSLKTLVEKVVQWYGENLPR